jgi:conjugative relaxase-like TrwC/TraI family protein
VGWATPIYAPEQVEYRLREQCGCDREHVAAPLEAGAAKRADETQQARDAQVDYRLAAPSDLRWIGSGLREVGIEPGTAVDPEAARALMDGRDPRTGERLVQRKQELDPRGKLPAPVLVDAIAQAAAEDGMSPADYLGTPGLAARFGRAERGVLKDGEAHKVPVDDVVRLAAAAGLDAEELYGARAVAEARRWRRHRVDVGVRGVDLVADLPKSVSAAYAAAPPELQAAIEAMLLESVDESVTQALEPWCAYGMTGHHGDGQRAQRIGTSGLLGWTVLHRSARPVDSAPGDPHLHVHITLAHMARCEDGTWRTIAAGADDLMRHAHVLNELVEARLRHKLITRYGARFERSPETGAWELAGIPAELREAWSRRHRQVLAAAGREASTAQQKAAARATAEAKDEATPLADVRAHWHTFSAAVLGGQEEREAMVRAALPGPGGGPVRGGGGRGPLMPSPQEIAAEIWDQERGLAAARKAVRHTHVMAAVAGAVPYLDSVKQLAPLTGRVLGVEGHAVRLPDGGRVHQSHRQRYTHTVIVQAESAIVEAAAAALGAGWAQLTEAAAELAVATCEVAQGFAFSAQQRAVVERLLTAGHGVDAVVGVAGAGKTTLMAAARAGWEAAGLRVAGASTAAVAAANLAAEAGIASRTVAAWTAEINGGDGTGLHGVDVLVIDEAAMVDDRALAVLLTHAAATGTKVVGVGDPLQLRAVGVGGGFARVHELVDGLVLEENRRQRDLVERAALAQWREGGRAEALSMLAAHGHVHASATATEALAAMLADWDTHRARWAGDPHAQLDSLLLMAARRDDVATLNAGARALRAAAGELGDERVFAIARGERIALAVGDLVHVRRNDYRTRRGGGVDVLNGYRGVVTHLDARRGVHVQWRRPSPDGPVLNSAWISPGQIAGGALTHGYAITVGSAQGLTADVAIAYGLHADAHTLYPALSRAREETHLHLPLAELEDHLTRVRLGAPRNDRELLDRAVAAYGRAVAGDRPDGMITDELAGAPMVAVPAQRPAPAAQHQAGHEQVGRQPRDDDTGNAGSAPQASPEGQQAAAEAVRIAAEGFPRPPQEALERYLAAGYASRSPESEPAAERRAAERDEEVADAPRPEPEPAQAPPWHQRPHGQVPTDRLEAEAAQAEQEAARARAAARQQRQAAAELAERKDTDRSTAAQTLARVTAALDDAERQLHAAAQAEQRAGDLATQITTMYQANRQDMNAEHHLRMQANGRLRRATFQRKSLLKKADTIAERLTERTARIDQVRQAELQARADARDLEQQARRSYARSGTDPAYGPLRGQIDDKRAGLPELAERLAAADRREHRRLLKQADQHDALAEQHQQHAQGLRAEKALREGMPPARQARESAARAQAAREAEVQRAAERARIAEQIRQQAQNQPYQPPTQGRSGRGFGR